MTITHISEAPIKTNLYFCKFKFVYFQITVVVANYTGTQEIGQELELDNADGCRCADRVKNKVLSVVVRKKM